MPAYKVGERNIATAKAFVGDLAGSLSNRVQISRDARLRHVDPVPVTEAFGGQKIWEGIVEVFELKGHPKANCVYACGPRYR